MTSISLDVKIVLFIHSKFSYAVTSCSLVDVLEKKSVSIFRLREVRIWLCYTDTVVLTVVTQIHRRGEEIPIYIILTYSQPTRFGHENEGSMIIQSAGRHLQDYMASEP
jgi:hypothetical protein